MKNFSELVIQRWQKVFAYRTTDITAKKQINHSAGATKKGVIALPACQLNMKENIIQQQQQEQPILQL
ncbi:MAG: hypothetical protein M3M89_05410 [Thermoproteota archaeon]|nr:hypothetical protein [Thermoproteota archaeon]